jgi:hypothetical protein
MGEKQQAMNKRKSKKTAGAIVLLFFCVQRGNDAFIIDLSTFSTCLVRVIPAGFFIGKRIILSLYSWLMRF